MNPDSKTKRRILFLMPTFLEQVIGGAEYQTYLLAEGAIQCNWEVHYAFVSNTVDWKNLLGMKLHMIRPHRLSKKLGATWFFYNNAVKRLLNEIEPEIIYVRGGWSFAAMSAKFSKRKACRSVWHVASDSDLVLKSKLDLIRKPFDIIERVLLEYAIKNSSLVIAQTNWQASELKLKYKRIAKVVPNFHPVPIATSEKNDDKFIITWIANIKPLKQPELFLKLAREFKDNNDVKFVMIGRPGRGLYMDKLKREIDIQHNLSYLREQPIDKVNKVLEKTHLFVNTSLYEGMPNTFIQAWLRSVPVVSIHVDPDHILEREKIGVRTETFDKLVEVVQALSLAKRDCLLMGRNSRIFAENKYGLKKNRSILLEILEGKETVARNSN